MKNVLNNFFAPLDLIRQEPLQFSVWWIVAMVLGLSSFWLPLLLHAVGDGAWYSFFEEYLKGGNFASFSIVVLADGIATTLVTVNAGRNITTAGIRGLINVFALLLAFVNVAIFILPYKNPLSIKYVLFQFLITFITIATASYLYCFRSSEWEKSVEDVKKKEEKEILDMGRSANARTSDDKGVKL